MLPHSATRFLVIDAESLASVCRLAQSLGRYYSARARVPKSLRSGASNVTSSSSNSANSFSSTSCGRAAVDIFPWLTQHSVRVLGRENLHRLQQVKHDLCRQRAAFLCQLEQCEGKAVCSGRAFANAVSCSLYGQTVINFGVPLFAATMFSLPSVQCYSGGLLRAVRHVPSFNPTRPTHETPQVFIDWLETFKEEVYTSLRAVYLLALFTPVTLLAPVCVGLGWGWGFWVDLVQWTLTMAGPAFIKWGQWAATRPDLFPPDICDALSKLHSSAPSHSYAFTRYAIERAFKRNMDDIFSDFEQTPVASGSIAQVHRAVLNDGGAFGSKFKAGTVVAVKVRHPGVTTMMQRDFTLMRRAAVLCASLPFLRDLRLEESVRQFGAPLKEQLDLSSEARALAKFNKNFRTWRNVSFPAPVYPLVASDVLVETFEPGRLISRHVESPTNRHNLALASLGLQSYLKMLLQDNFIHADLHPGNILVRVTDPNSLWGRVTNYFGLNTAPKLILLDVGMTAELSPQDSENLMAFFKAITTQDGKGLAENILGFTENQGCKDPEAFIRDMTQLFDSLDLNDISEHTSEIMQSMMEQIRKYQVNLKGIVSTVVVTTLVLEGWSTKLNPDIKILEALKALLPMPFVERLSISVDTLMSHNYGTTV